MTDKPPNHGPRFYSAEHRSSTVPVQMAGCGGKSVQIRRMHPAWCSLIKCRQARTRGRKPIIKTAATKGIKTSGNDPRLLRCIFLAVEEDDRICSLGVPDVWSAAGRSPIRLRSVVCGPLGRWSPEQCPASRGYPHESPPGEIRLGRLRWSTTACLSESCKKLLYTLRFARAPIVRLPLPFSKS